MQLVLDVKGSAESVLLGLTDSYLRVVIGVFVCLGTGLEQALTVVHGRIASISTPI